MGLCFRSKLVIPHLLKSQNPHILNLSPPLNLNPVWFKNHTGNYSNYLALCPIMHLYNLYMSDLFFLFVFFKAYTMAKYGMSMCVLGMAEEFRGQIAVNALWPRTGEQLLAC